MAASTVLNHPRSRGSLTLQSADPKAAPIIDCGMLEDPDDVSRLVDGVRRQLSFWKTEPIASQVVEFDPRTKPLFNGSEDDIVKHIKATGSHAWHPVGTCAIGKVVDESLCVMGVKNLRVADASILPNLSSGNTMIPAFLCGARAADIIMGK